MTNVNVHPIRPPDEETILIFLGVLFGQAMEGRVEICWTDANGTLKNAQTFDCGDLEDAAVQAAEVNVERGQNAYFGAALRKPETPPFGRCKDEDFHAAVALHADFDDEGASAQAKAVCKQHDMLPPVVVITGREPHPRTQYWWMLDEPITDPDLYRRLLMTVANWLGGDTTVTNPSRVMRLPGTHAWPHKKGRVLEFTELHHRRDRRQRFHIEEFERLESRTNTTSPVGTRPAAAPSTPRTLNLSEGLDVDSCIESILAGTEWHNNTVRVVGNWVSRGWSDTEIILAARSFTLPGYTHQQTDHEIRQATRGAREKWNVFDPGSEPIEQQDQQQPLKATPLGILDPTQIPTREWIMGGRLIRRFITTTIAPGGLSKTTLSLMEAIAVTTGKPITGMPVQEQGKVWFFGNEDPLDELRRRVAAICLQFEIDPVDLANTVFLDSGTGHRLIIAQEARNGVVATPDVAALISTIRKENIRLLVVDPFVRSHRVNENSNVEIDFVAEQFMSVAQQGDCAINLVHHTRKMPAGASHMAGDADASRGASALINAARIAHTITIMSKKEAEELGIDEDARHYYVRLDSAKANLWAPADGAIWFERVGVDLDNAKGFRPSDEVGVLVPWTPPQSEAITLNKAQTILQEIQQRFDDGNPFNSSPRSPSYVVSYITKAHDLRKVEAKAIVKDWICNNVLVSETVNRKTKKTGLRVAKWLG